MIARLKKYLNRLTPPSRVEPAKIAADSGAAPNPETGPFSADQPITSQAEDRFNRWPFAARIAETIARRSDPTSLVLAVYGVWGDGKTSALRLMEIALKDHSHVVIVRFNPWHFPSEAQLIRAFFETLADTLGRSLPTWKEDVGRLLSRYGGLISLASVSFLQGAVQISPGEGLRQLGESLSTVELDTLRARLEHILNESGKRCVILIDDIDRLDRQEIQAIFKLVKLSASFRHTVYVLAFDDEVVADSLGEKYGRGGGEAGRSFLEKIIQVPLHLPPADFLSLRRLTFEGVDAALRLAGIELTTDQVQTLVYQFGEGLQRRLITPRQAKRYANALAFALPILKGEVDPVDQLLLEGLRLFYPALYGIIRDNPDVFLEVGGRHSREQADRERAIAVIGRGLEGLDPAEQEAAKSILQFLFPRLKGVYGNTVYGGDAEERWTRAQRICSPDYFHRFFRYAVPPGDVADQTVESFLGGAAGADAATALRGFAERGAAPRLVAKLRLREDSIDAGLAEALALLISRNASALPREATLFGFDSTHSQAAILVMKLVRRISPGAVREALARRIIHESDDLRFAFECLRWFRAREDEPEPERLLPAAVEQELGVVLSARIRDAAAAQPLYDAFPSDTPAFLWAWKTYGTPGEATDYLTARFAAHPEETTRFLAAFVPTAWGGEYGLPHKSDLQRDSYDAVVNVIAPDILGAHLKAVYGAELDDPQYYPSRDLPVERRAAHQFVHIYNAIQRESGPTGDASLPQDV